MSDGWSPGMIRDLNTNLNRLSTKIGDLIDTMGKWRNEVQPIINEMSKLVGWEERDSGYWKRQLSENLWFTCWQVDDKPHPDVHGQWSAMIHLAIEEGDSDCELWMTGLFQTRQAAMDAVAKLFIEKMKILWRVAASLERELV